MYITGEEYKFNRGPYCFRINGQIYHRISQLEPEGGKPPAFSQIYIYNQQYEVDNHLRSLQNLDCTLMQELQGMIKEVNPYAVKYKQIGEVMKDKPTEDVQLVLKATGATVDPRKYNLPTGTDVAIIIPRDCEHTSSRDVVIYKNSSSHPDGHYLMNINTLNPMYDPLIYVLMFPHGDMGWQIGSHKLINRRKDSCTVLQYYKYRLMP